MRVYFAHPVSDYGSRRERFCLQLIKSFFDECEIVNPNKHEHDVGYKKEGMEYFYRLANTCDFIIAVPFRNSEFGMGVWKEMDSFKKKNCIYILVPETQSLSAAELEEIRPLSITQTRNQIILERGTNEKKPNAPTRTSTNITQVNKTATRGRRRNQTFGRQKKAS